MIDASVVQEMMEHVEALSDYDLAKEVDFSDAFSIMTQEAELWSNLLHMEKEKRDASTNK
jgi:hypothetical protein